MQTYRALDQQQSCALRQTCDDFHVENTEFVLDLFDLGHDSFYGWVLVKAYLADQVLERQMAFPQIEMGNTPDGLE